MICPVLTCDGYCYDDDDGGDGGALNDAGLSREEMKMNLNVRTPESSFALSSSVKLSCMIRYRASTTTSHQPFKKTLPLN